MASFFSGIQSYFKGEFGGRYVAVLLAEVCNVDPAPFRRFFADEFNDHSYLHGVLSLDPEFPFQCANKTRRADLLVRLDGKARALIELKFKDKLIPEGRLQKAQLSDYLRFCRRKKFKFLLLTKEPPTFLELTEIKKYGQRRAHFSRLAVHLGRSSELASQLLYKYFREKGLVVEPLNQDLLYRFFHRLLKPWGQAGRINSKDALSEGPVQFEALLSNMRLIASDLGPRFRSSGPTARSRSATIDFHLDGYFSAARLQHALKKQLDEDDVQVPDTARRGGAVYAYAIQYLGGKRTWIYVEYGIGFELKPGKIRSLSPFLYVIINGQGFKKEFYADQGINFSALTKPENKGEIENEIVNLVRKVAKRACKFDALTRQARSALLRI